jgi:hypothetical protein
MVSSWLIAESGKIISKTSVEHVIRDDYLLADKRKEIDDFNLRLEASLEDDANFVVDGEGEFDSLYLQDIIDDDLNPARCPTRGRRDYAKLRGLWGHAYR